MMIRRSNRFIKNGPKLQPLGSRTVVLLLMASTVGSACEVEVAAVDSSEQPTVTFIPDDVPLETPTSLDIELDEPADPTTMSTRSANQIDQNPDQESADADVATTKENTPLPSDTEQTDETAAVSPPEPSTSDSELNAPPQGEYFQPFATAASLDTFDFYYAAGLHFSNEPSSWPGDHDASSDICGMPSTSRNVTRPAGLSNSGIVNSTSRGSMAYWCAPVGPESAHMMTAINSVGYTLYNFSPKRTFKDVSKVCYDVNATNMGARKWLQVTIVPKATADEVAPRMDWVEPGHWKDGQGPGAWAMPVEGDTFMYKTLHGSASAIMNNSADSSHRVDKSVSDKIKRVTTCLTDKGNNQIEVEQERWDGSTVLTTLNGKFPDGESKVVFQDATYNADKATDQKSDSYTWHWDELYIN